MDLNKTLTRAWQIVWRNKILWFLGLLASCAGGGNFNTGSFNMSSSTSTSSTPKGDFNLDTEALRQFFETYGQAIVGGLIALVCISVVIGLVAWIIGILGRGALVAGVQQVEDNDQTTFRNAWAAARAQFGRLFGMNFILQLPMMIFGIVTLAGVIGIGAMLASQNSDFLNQLNDLDWQKIFVSVSPFLRCLFVCRVYLACIKFLCSSRDFLPSAQSCSRALQQSAVYRAAGKSFAPI